MDAKKNISLPDLFMFGFVFACTLVITGELFLLAAGQNILISPDAVVYIELPIGVFAVFWLLINRKKLIYHE